jgi:VanZ family protein
MTALVACLDEWHQTYLPKRTGSLHDVLLDSTAALVAQVVLYLILRWRSTGLTGDEALKKTTED